MYRHFMKNGVLFYLYSPVFEKLFGGANFLYLALMSNLAPESFEYALAKTDSVEQFKPLVVTDSLGITLVSATANPDYTSYFVQLLLREGAIVTVQHLNILQRVKVESPEIYEELILAVPGFSNF
jgi:hypothetical protein